MGRFAGSKTLDARRRRRLASEEDISVDASVDHEDVIATASIVAEDEPMPARGHNQVSTHLPIDRLIRRSPLHCFSIIVFVGVTAAGLFLANRLPLVTQQTWGSNVAQLLEFPHGKLAVLFRCGLVFGCALLSFLIGWARSRSQSDYSGEYRIWKWAWKYWAVVGICMATGAHVAFADVFSRLAKPTWNHADLLNWALPAALIGLPIQLRCWRDMSRCWSSTFLLVLSVTTFSVVTASPLFAAWDFLPAYIPLIHLVICCTAFSALLLHARFVLHVNVDPPESPLHNSLDEFRSVADLPVGTMEPQDEFAAVLENHSAPLPTATNAPHFSQSNETATEEQVLETALDLSEEFAILKSSAEADSAAAEELPDASQNKFRIETPTNEHEISPTVVTRRRKRSRR